MIFVEERLVARRRRERIKMRWSKIEEYYMVERDHHKII
jgi:hypothetical protein